ncbi:hypothetical protein PIB30_068691 [Stylosanthes scabra]|uniref:LAGLIDADG homing endonuclease n=1 Tax=Stylosanthes scabra TaxID=79078 RepID=A0ABU6QNY5_9FABA|nr:hypothetical protein [Stylosanthes scabra]
MASPNDSSVNSTNNTINSNSNNTSIVSSFSQNFFQQKLFPPLCNKLCESNHKTWLQQALGAIRGQLLEDHLYPSRFPPQYESDEHLSYEIWQTISYYFEQTAQYKIKQLKSELKTIKKRGLTI